MTRVRARGCWSFTWRPPLAAISSSSASGITKRRRAGVEVEQLGVAAPGNRGLNLPLGFFLAELLVEHVEKEVLGHGVVALGFECAANLAQQEHVLDRGVAEQLLLAQNFGVGELLAAGSDGRVALFDLEEAQHLRGIHDGQQIVDFEGQVVGQAIHVVAPALVEQQLEQAGNAAGPRVRQHLVAHLPLVARARPGRWSGALGRRHIGPREHFVDVVHQLREGLGLAVARLRQLSPENRCGCGPDCAPAR